MNTIEALNALLALMNAAMNTMASAMEVSAIITKAHGEGRTTLSADEVAAVKGIDDAARKQLADAIEAKGG
jgi:hypothetical protein